MMKCSFEDFYEKSPDKKSREFNVAFSSQVIIAVTTTKSMQSVTNIFIVNLAMADMLVMLFCAPPSVIWDVTSTWIFGDLMCRIVIYIQVRVRQNLPKFFREMKEC